MSFSYTTSETVTFTVTHAKHMAAKVAADLKRLQRLYGKPCDSDILGYETELIELIKAGCLEAVSYGFRRDGRWIEPTLRYSAKDLAGGASGDDDPGKIRPGADIVDATFYSYLTYSSHWNSLSSSEQSAIKSRVPFQRGYADEPVIYGYMLEDKTYSAGGRALSRGSVRSY